MLNDLDWQSLEIPQFSEVHRDKLEDPYTEKELHHALLNLNKGKTPGSDGLLVDFYIRFWEFTKSPLLSSLDFTLASGELRQNKNRELSL